MARVTHHYLPDILCDLAALVGRHTVIVSAMNGIESEARIGEADDRGPY
jgi:ketopantoate reductase